MALWNSTICSYSHVIIQLMRHDCSGPSLAVPYSQMNNNVSYLGNVHNLILNTTFIVRHDEMCLHAMIIVITEISYTCD